MEGTREFWEPAGPRKAFVLPPELDMGALKLDDLEFDLEREVELLKAEGPAQVDASPRAVPR